MAFDESIQYQGPFVVEVIEPQIIHATYWRWGPFAARPDFGNMGMVYISTDGEGFGGINLAYMDTGTAWELMEF